MDQRLPATSGAPGDDGHLDAGVCPRTSRDGRSRRVAVVRAMVRSIVGG